MTMIDQYLRAVQLYLPRGSQTDDILVELSENLQSKFEELEHVRGRPLTDSEQEAVLVDHGSPLVVAARYGAINRGLAFGRQLISPEVFPLYIRVLLTQYVLTIVVVSAIAPFARTWTLTLGRYLYPMLFQFLLTTSVFIAVDFFQRRRRCGGFGPGSRQLWLFPPPLHAGDSPLAVSVWRNRPRYDCALVGGDPVRAVAPPRRPIIRAGADASVARVSLASPSAAVDWRSAADNHVRPAGLELAATSDSPADQWRGPRAGLYWLINAAFSAWMCVHYGRQVLRRRRPQVS